MFTRRNALALPVLTAAAAAQAPAAAQTPAWPQRSLRLIIPWPPGQATDLIGRIFAQGLSERLGQSVVPENRGGAGGMIGTDVAAKAAPDGLTLLAASAGPVTIAPLVQRTPYDVERDLVAVGMGGLSPYLLVTRGDFPAQNIAEFLAVVRASPGRFTFASSGTGATSHLVSAYFNARTGLDAVHVPFQGSAPGMTALLGGQVDYALETAAAAMPNIRAGRLKVFGISLARGSALAPGVEPLARTANIPGFNLGAWIGIMVPTGVPAAIVERLSTAMGSMMAATETRERFAASGVETDFKPAAEFAEFLREQSVAFADVVRRGNIRAD